MNKKIINLFAIIVMSLILVANIKADGGLPSIQAICKVTLKDGSIIEGIITFGHGGYHYNYKPGGFCYVSENGHMKFTFYDFLFKKEQLYTSGSSTQAYKIYYVESLNNSPSANIDIQTDETGKIITRTKTEVDKYKFHEEMFMYKRLPLDMHVGYSQNNEDGKISIVVDQIVTVEILEEPGKIWLDLIQNSKDRFTHEMKLDLERKETSWEDYTEPLWYHEIIKDDNQVKYLQQYFEKKWD